MTGRPAVWRTIGGVAVVLGIGVALAESPARAAPIRAGRGGVSARELKRWDGYYRAALMRRDVDVDVPVSLRAMRAVDGLLPDSAFVDYLHWRRSLNVRRFDSNHRRLGPMLEMDRIIRTRLRPPIEPPRPPRVGGEILPPRPIPPGAPNVPEPSTAVIGAVMVLGFAGWRRRGQVGSSIGAKIAATGTLRPGRTAPPSSESA